MPFFDPGDDPGSNFPELLRRLGLADLRSPAAPTPPGWSSSSTVPHATTCVALRYDGRRRHGR